MPAPVTDLFPFRLMPAEDIPPWGDEEHPNLSWFGLTQGWFWMNVGDGQELFRYSQAAQDYWAQQYPGLASATHPYDDYQVARYWEDLLEMLPAILDPIPDDLAARIADAEGWAAWERRMSLWREADIAEDDDAEWDRHTVANLWWANRKWGAWHLAHPPRFWLWRVGDTLHIRWDNRGIFAEGIPVWTAQSGETTMDVTAFEDAVTSFHTRLVEAMSERVQTIRRDPGFRPEIQIDRDALEREHEERAGWLEPALRPWTREVRRGISWDQVRDAIAAIERDPLTSAL